MFLSRTIDDAKRFGLVKSMWVSISKILNKVMYYEKIHGMTLVLETISDIFLRSPSGYECKFLSEKELYEFASDKQYQMDEAFLDGALSKNDKCFGIMDGNRLASYGWYSSEDTRINDDLILEFNKAWIYMYKGYTHPDYRGKRLHAYGMGLALKEMSENGYKGLISYVAASNLRSLRSVGRMGYSVFGSISVIGFKGHFKVLTEKQCEQYNFTIRVGRK